jgi:hypothetical protein
MLATIQYDETQTTSQTDLASKLLSMLETCDPGHQDTATMHKIVVLIQQIQKADKERLKRAYGVNSEQYRTTLTMWLEAMVELVNIRTMLNLEGDRAKLLLESLSDKQFKSAAKRLCDAIHKVNKMRSAGGFTANFSGDLARIFIALNKWDWMRQTCLAELLTEFNMRLLGWFF